MVHCFHASPVGRYTYFEPYLKISSLHLILAYHAGTTLTAERKTESLFSLGVKISSETRFVV